MEFFLSSVSLWADETLTSIGFLFCPLESRNGLPPFVFADFFLCCEVLCNRIGRTFNEAQSANE